MKKLILTALAVLICAAQALAADTCRITYLKGNVFFATSGDPSRISKGEDLTAGDAVQTEEGSRGVFLFSQGAEIRTDDKCGITINKSAGNLDVKLEPGRYFVNAPFNPGTKHEVEYEGGKLSFSRGIIEINGKKAVFYSGRQQGNANKNVSQSKFPAEPSEWQVFNSLRDKRTVCLDVDAPAEYRDYYFEMIKKGAEALYPVNDVIKSEGTDCGLSCYVRVTKTPAELVTIVGFNRFVGNKAKLTEISTPFNSAAGASAGLFAANAGILSAQKAIEIELDTAASDAFMNGSDVTVEAVINKQEQAAIIMNYIKAIRGVQSVEMDMFYGQKAIFKVKTWGSAFDIAEALTAKKTENPSINVWHFDRNIVKLKFI